MIKIEKLDYYIQNIAEYESNLENAKNHLALFINEIEMFKKILEEKDIKGNDQMINSLISHFDHTLSKILKNFNNSQEMNSVEVEIFITYIQRILLPDLEQVQSEIFPSSN